MPLAALFIGGVLPAQLESLIRKRAGFRKGKMEIEKYTITYKIGNDIPINPAWIREQLQAAVAKLQAEIDKKNTHGQHVLEFK